MELMGSGYSDEKSWSSDGQSLPEIEARVCEKRALIKVHFYKRKGLLVKILGAIEKLNLIVLNTNVVPFGSLALDITITAEMSKDINVAANDIVETLRPALQAAAK